MQLGLAAAGPLVDGLRLADGPAHLPNREAPPVWLQWLPRRVYVQKHTRHCALWLYSLFFVVQLLWAVWSLVHNVAAVHALVDSLTARLDLLFTLVAPRLWAQVHPNLPQPYGHGTRTLTSWLNPNQVRPNPNQLAEP